MTHDEEPVKKILKKAYKDIEPVKDALTQVTEEEPKSIENMKRRLTKK